ncbi:MAG: S8 family serine peptidase [Bacteroidetes bacterium]|nr:S8 family serine peptidase [Bacteroidota bacterium]
MYKIALLLLVILVSRSGITVSQPKTNPAGIIIKFREGAAFGQQQRIVKNHNQLRLSDEKDNALLPGVSLALFKENNFLESQVDEIIRELEKYDEVLFANPLITTSGGQFSAVLGEFFVRLYSKDDYSKLESLAVATRTKILREYEYMPGVFILSADKFSRGNAREMAKYFSETKFFRYASPNMMFTIDACTANDPYYNRQWSIENTGSPQQYNGTPDADMDVDSAWTITAGDSTIKVAVLDSGVDTLQPDLIENLLPGFDATGNNSNGYPNTTYPEDGHGTSCAGIIGAVANNSIGVAGIAHKCKIIPVRIFYYVNFGGTIVPYSTNQWGADGINWAWQVAGADVLSNSWGIPDSLFTILGIDTAFSNDALNNAIDSGRGGKGLPALFSAGNSPDTFVLWPASLPSTIAVAATTMCDELKTFNDCSPENFWASNHGTGLDISAPGVRIATTDIKGVKGFSGGDYFLSFNGTSAACPNAAGVMALIISANKNITAIQARRIISETCDKTGGYSYNSNLLYGSWSEELGYGRVNAFAAIKSALAGGADLENAQSENTGKNFFIFLDEAGMINVHYYLPERGLVSVEIIDVPGRVIATYNKGVQEKGAYIYKIHPKISSPGIFFVRVYAGGVNYGGRTEVKKFLYGLQISDKE